MMVSDPLSHPQKGCLLVGRYHSPIVPIKGPSQIRSFDFLLASIAKLIPGDKCHVAVPVTLSLYTLR